MPQGGIIFVADWNDLRQRGNPCLEGFGSWYAIGWFYIDSWLIQRDECWKGFCPLQRNVQHLHSVGRVVTFDWAKLAPANAVNICMRSVAWFEENQMHSLVLYLIIVLYRKYVKYSKFKSNTQRRMTFCIHNGNMTRLSQWRRWCVE